jgi:hypothetical protein
MSWFNGWFKKSEARRRAQAIALIADLLARFHDQGGCWKLTYLDDIAGRLGVPTNLAIAIASFMGVMSGNGNDGKGAGLGGDRESSGSVEYGKRATVVYMDSIKTVGDLVKLIPDVLQNEITIERRDDQLVVSFRLEQRVIKLPKEAE